MDADAKKTEIRTAAKPITAAPMARRLLILRQPVLSALSRKSLNAATITL